MIYAHETKKICFNKFVGGKFKFFRPSLYLRIEGIEMIFSYRVPYIEDIKDRKYLIDFIFKQMEKPRLNLISSVEEFLFELKRNMNLRSIKRDRPYFESILYRIRTFSIHNINKTKYFYIRLKKSDTFNGFSVKFSEIYEEDIDLLETLIEGLQFK